MKNVQKSRKVIKRKYKRLAKKVIRKKEQRSVKKMNVIYRC